MEETKDNENDCKHDKEDEKEKEELEGEKIAEDDRENDIETENLSFAEEQVTKTAPVIMLNAQTIKSEDDTENLSNNNYAVYSLIGFGVLIALLFLLKRRRKNEIE